MIPKEVVTNPAILRLFWQSGYTETAMKSESPAPFRCNELWAGNEHAQRSVELAGLQANIVARPSEDKEGGDLCALFSCGEEHARVVVADCVGHGYEASKVAAHVHALLHELRDLQNSSRLLTALNDEFTLAGQRAGGPLRLTTLVTAIFHRQTGEFSFAYAAHPRMLLWREREKRWSPIGEGLAGLPIGFVAGEIYSEQSVRMETGDIVLIFSDGMTDVFAPDGEQLGAEGILEFATQTIEEIGRPANLEELTSGLVRKVRAYHGSEEFEDDFTLLALRRQDASQLPGGYGRIAQTFL